MSDEYILAIDVGNRNVKVVLSGLEQDKHISILAGTAIASSGFRKGDVTDVEKLADCIFEAVNCIPYERYGIPNQVLLGIGGMGLTGQLCIGSVGIESDRILNQDVSRAFNSAVVAAVKDHQTLIHAIPIKYWIDGKECNVPLNKSATQLQVGVYIVTATKAILDNLLSTLSNRGIDVDTVVANIIAQGQTFDQKKREQGLLFIDIGAGTADAVIYDQGAISLVISLPLGGSYIVEDVAKGLHISNMHAEKIVRYYNELDSGLWGKDLILDCGLEKSGEMLIPYDFLAKIIESRVEEITSLILEYLQPYLNDNPPSNVTISGGCAAMPSFLKHFSQAVGTVVQCNRNGFAEYAHPMYSACVGITRYALINNRQIHDDGNRLYSFIQKVSRIFGKN